LPLTQSQLLLTSAGEAELLAEVASLERIRQQIVAELEQAGDRAGAGDRQRHGELVALGEQIACLRRALAEGVRVEDDCAVVAVGAGAVVADETGELAFTIVGPADANPCRGRISYESPLARAAMGRAVGDEIELALPEGQRRLRITSIRRASLG